MHRSRWLSLACLVFAGVGQAADPPAASPVAAAPAAVAATEATVAATRHKSNALALDATAIRGNQELPKVLYIVPWKDPAAVELSGRPVNSLVEEVLAPVDREVFRRQTRYFSQLYGTTSVKQAADAPGGHPVATDDGATDRQPAGAAGAGSPQD